MLTVRFAPSPTGYLHIGGARTFILQAGIVVNSARDALSFHVFPGIGRERAIARLRAI
jgi:hypothetical protein